LVKKLFIEWINSKTTGEVYSLLEIKNLLKILKLDFAQRLSKKVANGDSLDEVDMKRIQQMLEGFTNLHKLQHGEKKTIIKMDYQFIRDLT
ncbi:MAG: hypothetical protein IH948_08465, partial [Bacteroidetes bacterium]|nr:hypothetical protein [Bacteroidota bacterium]